MLDPGQAERLLIAVHRQLLLQPKQRDGSWMATVIQSERYAIMLREAPEAEFPLALVLTEAGSDLSLRTVSFVDLEEGVAPFLDLLRSVEKLEDGG